MKNASVVLPLLLLCALGATAQPHGFVGVGLEPTLDRGLPFAASTVVGINVSKATAITGRFVYSDQGGPAPSFLLGVSSLLTDFDCSQLCGMSGDVQVGRVRSRGKWRTTGSFGVGFPFDLDRGWSFVPGVHVNYVRGAQANVSFYVALSRSF